MSVAVFTRGSVFKHLIIMTAVNTLSLLALVISDLIDMYCLSLLGNQELAAAIGFAGTLMFFLVSTGLGLQVALAVLVAHAEGTSDREKAKRVGSHSIYISFAFTSILSVVAWLFHSPLLSALGATGSTLQLASDYCSIVLPATPALMVGMCCASVLRAMGDARRSISSTFVAAAVIAILDPLLIVSLNMGVQGAAWAAVVARTALMVVGVYILVSRHRYFVRPSLSTFKSDAIHITRIAIPAMLTTLSTPLGSAIVIRNMAEYGDTAVAGAAIIGRLVPVLFGVVLGMSVSIGPILGQNASAGLYSRVRQAVTQSLWITIFYVSVVWLLFGLFWQPIASLFGAEALAAQLIQFYAQYLVGGFIFVGMLIIAVAGFNNLHMPNTSTLFNLARIFLGVVPAVYLLGGAFGAKGILCSEVVAVVIWGSAAYALFWNRLNKFAYQPRLCPEHETPVDNPSEMEFSSGVSQLGVAVSRQSERG